MTEDQPDTGGGWVSLILDTSALLAYDDPRRSIHVGEPVAELADDPEALFAVPVMCLADAVRAGASVDMLRVLTDQDACLAVAVLRGDWAALGRNWRHVGRLDVAAAGSLAARYRAPILTAEPAAYPSDWPIIPVGE